MTYYQVDRIIDHYVIAAELNNEINNTWGPEADIAVINKVGSSALPTSAKEKAANHYVGYLYFMYLGQVDRAQKELDLFNAVFADYLLTLTPAGGLPFVISSKAYKSYPLNPDALPYSSTRPNTDPFDDSDL